VLLGFILFFCVRMKPVFGILFLLLPCFGGFSQTVNVDSADPLFRGRLNGESIRMKYDDFEPFVSQEKPKGPYNQVTLSLFHSRNLYVGTALNKKEDIKELDPYKSHSTGRGYTTVIYPIANAVPLFDSAAVLATAYGINERNAAIYRFRVLENGSKELVPWRQPKLFCPVYMFFRHNADGSDITQMAYLGAFGAPVGNSITIEVKNLRVPDTVYRISAVWIKRAPRVIATFEPEKLKQLIDVYKYQWKYDALNPGATYYGDIRLQPVDSLLVKDTVFTHDQNNLFFYLRDKVKKTELVEYNLVSDGDSSGWKSNGFDPNIIWLKRLAPANYILLLRYAFQRQTVGAFHFRIRRAWYQTWWFGLALVSVCALFLWLLYSFFSSRKQRRLLQQQTVRRQQAEIGLQSIRAQFNPHFVFNALSSIRGLIQKRDADSADRYLSEFSRLMRESLQSGNKEMVSVDKELAMLTSYIELEKLRFKFDYRIRVAEGINVHSIEIPTLLLQPLIENAIKHGISGLYEKGTLRVDIRAKGHDMEVEIVDNGGGFDVHAANKGYGIRLTMDRIGLLSSLRPEQPITLNVGSAAEGTTVILLFKNWLI